LSLLAITADRIAEVRNVMTATKACHHSNDEVQFMELLGEGTVGGCEEM